MDYCAEVSYIRCNNGYKLPMEIAFACVDIPRQVFILHMRMPHDVHFTVADLVCNKGQCERHRNKAYNVHARCILKMDRVLVVHAITFYSRPDGLGCPVGCSLQKSKQFFKMVGGFRNAYIVKPPVGNHAYGYIHSHNRLISFPCAAKATRTLAVNLNRTHWED
ncbi:hypothetical protein TNCV_706061 [Trichonephila clavipes]|nr:hypothetical protein TNCV_706061 [Trichonephila clavipes]